MGADNTARPERKPPIPHSKYKVSPAARAKAAFAQLCKVLEAEWPTLRCLNLGVKSGNGVIDDVLLSQCHQLASTVHMLSVLDPDASREVVRLACRLTPPHFQELLVLLDTLGLPDLSDFLRLMCCSLKTHRPGGGSSGQAAGKRPSSSATTASNGRLTSTGILKSAGSTMGEAAGSTTTGRGLTSRQRRMPAAAGVFELAQAGFADMPGGLQQADDDGLQQQQQAGLYGVSSSPEPSPLGLKFASLLPPGHILVKTAEALKQQQEFQAALAHVTPCLAKQRTAVLPLHLPQQEQQGTALPDIHLAGYSRYHPNDLLGPSVAGGTWQQQQQQQQGTGSPPSTAGGCSSSCGQSPPPHHHAAAGPWRGSLLEGSGAPHHNHPGAFFLSSYGGQLEGQGQGQVHISIGQLRHQQQQPRQQFRAPAVSIQQLWKLGRAATTAAVLEAAHLSVHESAGDALSLLLVPGLVVQRRVVQPEQRSQLSTPESTAAGGGGGATLVGSRSAKLASRRASMASRRSSTANNNSGGSMPNSARGGRPSSAVPALPLQRLVAEPDRGGVGAGGEAGGVGSSGSGSSRPGSGAGTSRLAHVCAAIDENKTFVTATAVCMD